MISLEDAIQHCLDVSESNRDLYETYIQHGEQGKHVDDCFECAIEHKQLAEWLEELKERRLSDDR